MILGHEQHGGGFVHESVHRLGHHVALHVLAPPNKAAAPLCRRRVGVEGLGNHRVAVHHCGAVYCDHRLGTEALLAEVPDRDHYNT
jgi:hypothetical protein